MNQRSAQKGGGAEGLAARKGEEAVRGRKFRFSIGLRAAALSALGLWLATHAGAAAAAGRVLPDGVLAGTFVVEGGTSFALLQPAGEMRLVRQGDEIVAGARLAEVRTDRIVVDVAGTRQEYLLSQARGGAVPRVAPLAPAVGNVRGSSVAGASPAAGSRDGGYSEWLAGRAELIQARLEAVQRRWLRPRKGSPEPAQ